MNAPFLLPGCELIESEATAALEQLTLPLRSGGRT